MSRRQERMWAVSVGSYLCPECGEAPSEERRPSRWERFRYWLVNGSKAPTTLVSPNGHEWVHSFGAILFWGTPSLPRWVRLPGELLRVLLGERRMQPTPMTYLLAAGVGLLLGLALEWVLEWPWWAVAAGFVVLVWLFFLSSAFRGPDTDIGRRLLRVLDPDRAAERDRQRLEEALASGSLAGYEVESWDGAKSISGWSGSPDPDSLTIRHGEFDEEAEWVEVTTHSPEPADTVGHWMKEELERRLVEAQFSLPEAPQIEDFQQRERNIRKAEPPEWQSTSFRVDHREVQGQIARVGSQWAAFIDVGQVLIEVTANGVDVDQIHLVQSATFPRSD